MTYITENCKIEIETKGAILDVIGDYVTLSNKGVGDCPFCNSKKKFNVSKQKGIWKCWSCDTAGVGYVGFVTKVKNLDWLQTMKFLADRLNINLEYEQAELPLIQPKQPAKKEKKAEKQSSFRDQQLAASGLNDADQRDEKKGNNDETTIEIDRYQKGTLNERWEIDPSGDDMILHYMDLNNNPMLYNRKGTSKDFPLIRIRYQHPELWPDKNGRPTKYKSPYNSGSRIWINKTIRTKYKNRIKIKCLATQEGEKKADKSTKHGLDSVGIMGIHNIANSGQLAHEYQLIVKQCEVEEVVFFVDADFCDIGSSIDAPVDQRPRSFVAAIMNFRKYFHALNSSGIHLQIYFAYVRKEHKQKGVDDLLKYTLEGQEDLFLKDFEDAKLHPQGIGHYVNCHNITAYNEFKLRKEFFHLDSNVEFAKHHMDLLKERKVFLIGREKFHFNEENELELAQPISHEEQFWEEYTKKKGDGTETVTTFKYVECCMFLQNKKFGRYALQGDGEFNFIRVEDNVVRVVKPSQIKDYLSDFVKFALQKKNVQEMFFRGYRMYLDNFNNLDFITLKFHKSDKGIQFMYFNKVYWKITSEGVEEKQITELDGHVWKDKIKDFSATIKPLNIRVKQDADKKFSIEYPQGKEEAEKCMFYQYYMNTSNFHWRDTHEGIFKIKKPNTPKTELSDLKKEDLMMHFINKCCGFGFLLHDYFDANRAKAVIAMDGVQSEVGDSNGRSGKSLNGTALEKLIPTVIIPGKQKDIAEDKFILEEVNERTRVVNIDDVRVNFDFENWFSHIGGNWKINPKGKPSFRLTPEESPKILITTNHALNGEGGSFEARQFKMAFSDYYSAKYQPVDEHGCMFFSEWSDDQWNRFYNFAANCVQIYFEHGLVEAPMERLEKRRLRQQIGEIFLEWAESYYDHDNEDDAQTGKINYHLNKPFDRKIMLEDFYAAFPEQKQNKYMDTRVFKRSIKRYCLYKGYVFNPTIANNDTGDKDGGRDKRNNVEYFTVFDSKVGVLPKKSDDMPF
ncbi:MAG: hypothetical protein A3F72_03085 [Bacteroidetes bacterium RIFCSPLOWO2_12_FULL_35_15]|nr:MAG: hypothetical protein A3F72_03085 [Bacteroidetes bacterium RIFCSPLOWO2_12_FULL_35_15]